MKACNQRSLTFDFLLWICVWQMEGAFSVEGSGWDLPCAFFIQLSIFPGTEDQCQWGQTRPSNWLKWANRA